MANILMILVIGAFLAILFLNVYFRVKVLKVYRKLVQNQVQFNAIDVFNKKKLETEILPKYPKSKDDIVTFANHIKFSVRCASGLLLLITAFYVLLMYMRT